MPVHPCCRRALTRKLTQAPTGRQRTGRFSRSDSARRSGILPSSSAASLPAGCSTAASPMAHRSAGGSSAAAGAGSAFQAALDAAVAAASAGEEQQQALSGETPASRRGSAVLRAIVHLLPRSRNEQRQAASDPESGGSDAAANA